MRGRRRRSVRGRARRVFSRGRRGRHGRRRSSGVNRIGFRM